MRPASGIPRGRGQVGTRGQPVSRAPPAGRGQSASRDDPPVSLLERTDVPPPIGPPPAKLLPPVPTRAKAVDIPTIPTIPTIPGDPTPINQPAEPNQRRPFSRDERLQVLTLKQFNNPITLRLGSRKTYKVQHSVLVGVSRKWQREIERVSQNIETFSVAVPNDDVADRFIYWLFYRELVTDKCQYRKVWDTSQEANDNRHDLVQLYNFAIKHQIFQLQNQIVHQFYDTVAHWLDAEPDGGICPVPTKTFLLIYLTCDHGSALWKFMMDVICEGTMKDLPDWSDPELLRTIMSPSGSLFEKVQARKIALKKRGKPGVHTVVVGWETDYRVEGDLASSNMLEADDAPGRPLSLSDRLWFLSSDENRVLRVKFGPEGVEHFVQAGLLMGASPVWRRKLLLLRGLEISQFPLPETDGHIARLFLYWLFYRNLDLEVIDEHRIPMLIQLYDFGSRCNVPALQNAILSRFRQTCIASLVDDTQRQLDFITMGGIHMHRDLFHANIHILFEHMLCEGVLKAGDQWYASAQIRYMMDGIWGPKYYDNLIAVNGWDRKKPRISTVAIQREGAYMEPDTV